MTDLIDVTQLAEILRISVPTLARWRMLQVGPVFVKLGRHVRYRRQDVESWVVARRQAAGANQPETANK